MVEHLRKSKCLKEFKLYLCTICIKWKDKFIYLFFRLILVDVFKFKNKALMVECFGVSTVSF